jgi:beta-lactamase regulating signal transducer with metallopeptidase domain
VTLDRANRSFLALFGIALALGALAVCGAIGGVLLPLALAGPSHRALLSPQGPSLLAAFQLVVLTATGVLLGVRSLARQAVASIRLARRVRSLAIAAPVELIEAAARAGLAGRVVLVDASGCFSFVHGILTPRVAVSRALLESASRGEMRAVLEHERYHVRNLDPLKAVLVRVLSQALFFLPALNALLERYLASRELAADRRAVAICGPRPLAEALLKVLRGPDWSELDAAAAIGGPELLDVRVAQLETGVEPRLQALDATRAAISLLALALLVLAFLATESGLGGPTVVHHATGAAPATALVLGGLYCGAPIAGAGFLAYTLLALRASRPRRLRGRSRS